MVVINGIDERLNAFIADAIEAYVDREQQGIVMQDLGQALHGPIIYGGISKRDVLQAWVLLQCNAPRFEHFGIAANIIPVKHQ